MLCMLVDDVVLQFGYTFEGIFGAFASRVFVSKAFRTRLALTVAINSDFHEDAFFRCFVSTSHYRVTLTCSVFVNILNELSARSILIQELRWRKELHTEVVGVRLYCERIIGIVHDVLITGFWHLMCGGHYANY